MGAMPDEARGTEAMRGEDRVAPLSICHGGEGEDPAGRALAEVQKSGTSIGKMVWAEDTNTNPRQRAVTMWAAKTSWCCIWRPLAP
eukprot:9467393-Pyramimonas_sp.AAC.1